MFQLISNHDIVNNPIIFCFKASYGRSALLASLISKSRQTILPSYGLLRENVDLSQNVQWLLKGDKFVFDGIDLKVSECDFPC